MARRTAENYHGKVHSGPACVAIFVTNLDLLPNEGANAFRVFAQDAKGTRFRFSVESLSRLPGQKGVYALTLRIFDPNGYNGQPAADSDLALTVSWRGNLSNPVRLALGPRVRQSTERNTASPTASAPRTSDVAAAVQVYAPDHKRFMEQAAFGPSRSLESRLRRIGVRSWINEQFTTPNPTIPYPNFPLKAFDAVTAAGCGGSYGTSPEIDLCYRNHYGQYRNQTWMFQEGFYGNDQLRRRVSWSLHQIWVVSGVTVYQQRWMQEYFEILDRNAFGNYRDLMREMTLSPAMGEYLDMVRSTRQNPNENYPCELLQLFTTGLYLLNQDGTLVLDNQGNRIPTYDQEKVNQFTKIFTGWTRCDNGALPDCSSAVAGTPNFIDPMILAVPGNHDLTAKTLFNYQGAPNTTIAACSNCTTDAACVAYANDSLDKTLDNIFNHPNIGPYIGKLLIQHLVTSDPSPAYVSRVAAAFNNNGLGVRGDMRAVVKTILLDREARGSAKTDPTYGKLREPFQYLTNMLRTFGTLASEPYQINGQLTSPPVSCQDRSDGELTWMPRDMGQDMWVPQSVFGYFAPDYVVPGTDILGPEFALANTTTSFLRNNLSLIFAFDSWRFNPVTATNPYPFEPCGTSIDRSEPLSWIAADPTGNTLIEGLNWRMMHGTMSEAMKTKIRAAINFPVDQRAKIGQSIYLVTSSSQYQIQR